MTEGTLLTMGAIRASRGLSRRGLVAGLSALMAGAIAAAILSASGAGSVTTASVAPARHGLAALLRLPAAARAPISAALGRDMAGYRITGLTATNRAQRFSARFVSSGVVVHSGATRFELGLSGIERGQATGPAGPVAPVTHGARVVYARPGLRETWTNGPLGLEQTFLVGRRPAGAGALTLAVSAPVGSHLVGQAVRLPGGLSYTGLRATDATGRVLRSWVQLQGRRALLRVDDAGAAYPITVDPYVEQNELSEPGSPTTEDEFGYSVAISGGTIVVGASHVSTGGDSASGAAFVFQQGSSGSWTEKATLTPSDPGTSAQFGWSVAISGDTIVVGAPNPNEGGQTDYGENPCLLPSGTAYTYEAQGGTWKSGTQTSELAPSEPLCERPAFGNSVAIDGNTVVVGAPYWYSNVGNVGANALPGGAAFVYTLSNGTPTGQPAELTTAPASVGSNCPCAPHFQDFGLSVGVSGSTIIVGAPSVDDPSEPGAAYVYSENAGSWSTTTSPSYSLAASDGAAGDDFGWSVAVDGGTAVVAAPNHSGSGQHEGALYVFNQQSAGSWPSTQSAELTPSDPTSVNDTALGYSGVAISGSTIIGGTPEGTGSLNAPAGYEFTEPAGGWSGSLNQTQKLVPKVEVPVSDAGNYATVTAVGISGTTVVLGSDTAPPGSGAAFVFGPGSAVGAGASGRATVSGDSVSTKATCTGAATTSCKLTYSLTTRETVETGKPVGVAASKKAKRTKKTVSVGSTHLVLTGGGARTVKLTLNGTGKALLAKFRTLPTYLTVTQAHAPGAAKVILMKTVTFHAAKAKKKTK
jgi:hypothetical protein